MFEKPSPEQLAEKAVRYLDLAEKHEAELNWAKAIESYSKAVDLLKMSGLLLHHVDDINERITHLKQMTEQEKAFVRHKAEVELDSFKDQAFHLLDEAKSLEQRGRFQEAISRYTSAISLLEQANWDESSLGNIKLKLEKLVELFRQQQMISQQKALQATQTESKIEKSFGAPGVTIIPAGLDRKSKLKMEFEIKKQKEDDIQNRAFEAIDIGKKHLDKKDFESADSKYLEALNLLKSIGWTDENLMYLYTDIDTVERQKVAFEKAKKQKIPISTMPALPELLSQKQLVQEPIDLQSRAIMEYEVKKKREEDIQKKAFELMDEGERLARGMEFDNAMEKYGMAGQLLESIGWADQLVHINKIIEKINKDKIKIKKFQAQQVKAKETTVTPSVPKISVRDKAKVESQKEKIAEFEERKKSEEQIQNNAFKMIDSAKRFEREKAYERAIENFNGAIDLLQSIGWNDYVKPIYKFISDIRIRQENEQKVLEEKKVREKESLKFQELIQKHDQIQAELEDQMISAKKKEIEKKEEIERAKDKKAFKVISEADEFVRRGEYEKAINTYKKARDIFREIGWTDQIAIIDTTINTIDYKYKEFLKDEEKAKEIKVKRTKEEGEFQNMIAEQIKKERKKLEHKEIKVRKYEEEIEYRNRRKVGAFKILDEAEEYTLRGEFDVAIERYHAASIIFAEIQWTDELTLIQNAVQELENKKKERNLLKLKEREGVLKRTQEAKEFQDMIAGELRKEREKLREKEIAVREFEQEVKYREKRKEEAFRILDKAQKMTINGDFDNAIEDYEEASIIFAEIQWNNELELIQSAISELESKKKEKVLLERENRELLLKREQEAKEFQDMIAKELNKVREKLRESQIVLREYEKEVEYRESRKNEAFNILEAAKMLIMRGDLDAAIDKYHEASIIFAEIQWTDELVLIQNAIRKLENQKKQRELWEQKVSEEAIRKEQKALEFQHEISLIKSRQEEKVKLSQYIQEQKKILSTQQLKKQEEALKLLEDADEFIREENLDEAIKTSKSAVEIFSRIGWKDLYLKVIQDTLDNLHKRKLEIAKRLQQQKELAAKHETEEREFQEKIAQSIESEKKRMLVKKIAVQNKEQLLAYREKRRIEAFDIMNKAEILTKRGNFNESLSLYRQADVILSEIQFPSYAVKEMIQKIKVKQKQRDELQQKERKVQIQRQLEIDSFQKDLAHRVDLEKEKMEMKKIAIETHEKIQVYREQQREEAFKILDEAEELTKLGNFELATNTYRNAALLLSKIQFPVDSIHEMIKKVRLKKVEQEKLRQREIEAAVQRERDEREFRERIAWELRGESERLRQREIALKEYEAEVEFREDRKKDAFDILDSAKLLTLRGEFDTAIEKYNEASIILAEIQWIDELPTIQKSIDMIKNKKKERELWEQKAREKAIKREIEEREFQEKISEILENERKKLKEKEIALREYEDEVEYREKRKEDSFKILDEAEKLTNNGDFDAAIKKYHDASIILAEIQWTEELALIQNTIHDLEYRKKEQMLGEQKAREEAIWKEIEAKKFQTEIAEILKEEREKLKEKEIAIREYEEEVKHRERRKEEAFVILDSAKVLTTRGNFDAAIEKYHKASIILAEIQWIEELEHIQDAIRELERKKKEKELVVQKVREDALRKEQEEKEFHYKISLLKAENEEKIEMEQFIQEQQKILSEQNLLRQNEALRMLETADIHIKQGNLDDVIEIYVSVMTILSEIGWTKPYLKVIQDTFDNINKRKREVEQVKQKEIELVAKRDAEEKEFQDRIAKNIETEKQKMLTKKIEVQTQEELFIYRENRRKEAFNILNIADGMIKEENFEDALKNYRQADIILSEIQFPSNVVKEMIQKVKLKQKEQEELHQKERELQLQNQLEEETFQREIVYHVQLEKEKMRVKEIALEGEKIVHDYREQRREEAFRVLEEAERLTKAGKYELAINTYRNATLILSEIQYPTDSINEMITKVQTKKIEQERIKQRETVAALQREQEEKMLEEQVARQVQLEQERMMDKLKTIVAYEKLETRLEQRKEEAFKVLEEAEQLIKTGKFDEAIEAYRKSALILSEIQYPLDSINEMIKKVQLKKTEQDLIIQRENEAQLQREREEAELRMIIEERQRQDEEMRKAKNLALRQREELIAKVESRREVAFSLMENADNFLKQYPPDFDKAIELYLEAKNILLEINWEPEIANLDTLIRNLREEKQKFLIRQRQEEETRIRAAEEYEKFEQEILRKKLEVQRLQEEQLLKLEAYKLEQVKREQLQKEGFDLLDDAKKSVAMNYFTFAYEQFEQAIEKFKSIGWVEQIKYIEKEIGTTKKLEENAIKSQLEVKKSQEALVRQKELDLKRRIEEKAVKKQSVKTINALSDDIIKSLRKQRLEQERTQVVTKKEVKLDAAKFAKDLGKMIKIKQDLETEIAKSDEEQKKKRVEKEKQKAKEELKELHKWIKNAGKKSKDE